MINDCFQRFFLFLCQSFSMFCVAREVYAIGGLGSKATARPPQSAARLPNESFPTSRARSHVHLSDYSIRNERDELQGRWKALKNGVYCVQRFRHRVLGFHANVMDLFLLFRTFCCFLKFLLEKV